MLFGIAATVVIGMVGLGTEGGTWYLTKRDAQNAADAAAYAGATRLAFAQGQLAAALGSAQAQARTAATETSTRNGFTSGQASTTVTPNAPPTSGVNAGNPSAVEVIVSRTRTRAVSRLFLGTDPVIRVRGVAALTSNGPVCVLALTTGLTIQGNSITGTGCSLGSNATSSTAININGNPTISATSLVSSGGCNGCGGLPFQTYQSPSRDPYAALNSIAYTKPTSAIPTPPKSPPTRYSIAAPKAGEGFLSDVQMTGGSWDFAPGTYVFWESSLSVSGGSITCSACVGGAGVTFVFTGANANKVGTATINTNGVVTLSAPTSGTYAGVLIYRDDFGASKGTAEVKITGGASMTLSGAIYAPTSHVSFSGNSATSCVVLVGGEIDIGGTSVYSTANCPSTPGVPTSSIVRLVE